MCLHYIAYWWLKYKNDFNKSLEKYLLKGDFLKIFGVCVDNDCLGFHKLLVLIEKKYQGVLFSKIAFIRKGDLSFKHEKYNKFVMGQYIKNLLCIGEKE